MITVVHRLRARTQQPGTEEGGYALLVALFFVVLVGGLCTAALALVLNQMQPTLAARKNVATVNSANAGMEAALTTLRAAVTGTSTGVRGRLPCTTTVDGMPFNGAVISGSVTGSNSDTYTTRVRYFLIDPTGQPEAWLTANRMPCPLTQTPLYALLQNAGGSTSKPDGHAQRAFTATYKFSTTNRTVVGGQLRTSGSCWDVGASPAVGSPVTLQSCAAAGTPRQTFSYRADLSVQWSGGAPAANLCLDYRTYWSSPAVPAVITLQQCTSSGGASGSGYDPTATAYTPAGARFQEFATSGTTWYAVEPDDTTGRIGDATYTSGGTRKACLGVSSANQLMMQPSGCKTASATNSVGAGGASGAISGVPGPTKQLINYDVYGSCVDVSGSIPANGLILYPCHQAPDPAKVEGNQRFSFGAAAGGTGTITTRRTDAGGSKTAADDVKDYDTVCLTGAPVGQKPTLTACVSGAADQQWAIAGAVPGDYDTSYTLVNGGRCLGVSGTTILLQTCNGSTAQKWNAPSQERATVVNGFVETTQTAAGTP